MSLRRSWGALTALAVVCLLAVPAVAAAQSEDFDPSMTRRPWWGRVARPLTASTMCAARSTPPLAIAE